MECVDVGGSVLDVFELWKLAEGSNKECMKIIKAAANLCIRSNARFAQDCLIKTI